MKKLLIALSILLSILNSAKATEDLVLYCTPKIDSNDLNISWVKLEISQDDPVAAMIWKYYFNNTNDKDLNMDYSGTETEYDIIPSTQEGLFVELKWTKGYGWEATLSKNSVRGVTEIFCEEGN